MYDSYTVAPNVVSSPKVQNFRIHTSINVTCLVTGGIRDVEWQRNNQTIAHSNTFIANSRYEVLSSGSLHIFNITEQDSGHYRCIVSNKAGKHSQNIEVNVMNEFTQYQHNEQHDIFPLDNNGCVTQMGFIKEFFQDIKDSSPDYYAEQDIPYFTAKPPHCIQTIEGFNVVLQCSAEANPNPSIRWIKDRKHIININKTDRYVQLPNGSLKIYGIHNTDRGVYTCQASTMHWTRNTTVRIRITTMKQVCGTGGHNVSRSGLQGTGTLKRARRVVGGEISDIENSPWQVRE